MSGPYMTRAEVEALIDDREGKLRSLVAQLQGALGGRVVSGSVTAAGALASGEKFTCSRLGAGDFLVTFSTPYSSIPRVVATAESGAVNVFAQTTGKSATGFRVLMRSDAGVAVDAIFDFVAHGPIV